MNKRTVMAKLGLIDSRKFSTIEAALSAMPHVVERVLTDNLIPKESKRYICTQCTEAIVRAAKLTPEKLITPGTFRWTIDPAICFLEDLEDGSIVATSSTNYPTEIRWFAELLGLAESEALAVLQEWPQYTYLQRPDNSIYISSGALVYAYTCDMPIGAQMCWPKILITEDGVEFCCGKELVRL